MRRYRRKPISSVSAKWASATPRRRPRSRPPCSAAAARAGPAAAPASTTTALARKRDVIDRALDRHAAILHDPLRIAAALGGRELAAILGAALAARRHNIPVLLDGFVCTAAVAPLYKLRTDTLAHALAGHASAEAGHRMLLDELEPEAAPRPRHAARRSLRRGGGVADPARGARLPHRHGDVRRGRRLRQAGGRERRSRRRRGRRLILIPLPLWERALKQAFASEAGEGGPTRRLRAQFPLTRLAFRFASMLVTLSRKGRGEDEDLRSSRECPLLRALARLNRTNASLSIRHCRA